MGLFDSFSSQVGHDVIEALETAAGFSSEEKEAFHFFRHYGASFGAVEAQARLDARAAGPFLYDPGWLSSEADYAQTTVDFEVAARLSDVWSAWVSGAKKIDAFAVGLDAGFVAPKLSPSYFDAIDALNAAIDKNYASSVSSFVHSMQDSLAAFENAIPMAWTVASLTFAAPQAAVVESIEEIGTASTILNGIGDNVLVAQFLYSLVKDLLPNVLAAVTRTGMERIEAFDNIAVLMGNYFKRQDFEELHKAAKGLGVAFDVVGALDAGLAYQKRMEALDLFESNYSRSIIDFFAKVDMFGAVEKIVSATVGLIDLINVNPLIENAFEGVEALINFLSSAQTDMNSANLDASERKAEALYFAMGDVGKAVETYFDKFAIQISNSEAVVSAADALNQGEDGGTDPGDGGGTDPGDGGGTDPGDGGGTDPGDGGGTDPGNIGGTTFPPPYLMVVNASSSGAEEGSVAAPGELLFRVDVIGERFGDISFDLTLEELENLDGVADIGAIAGHYTIAAEDPGSLLIHVPLIGDGSFERTEHIKATLSGVTGAELRAGVGVSATGTILDDDAGNLDVNQTTSDSVAVEDGNADMYRFVTAGSGTFSVDVVGLPGEAEVRLFDYLGNERSYDFVAAGEDGRIEFSFGNNELYFVRVAGISGNPDGYSIRVSDPASTVVVPPAGPADLVIDSVSVSGVTVSNGDTVAHQFEAGDTVSISALVENAGLDQAALSYTAFVGSPALGMTADAVDTPRLAAGATATVAGPGFALPDNIADGLYAVGLRADHGSDVAEGAVGETNNDFIFNIQVGDVVTDADVATRAPVLSESLTAGQEVTIRAALENVGGSASSGGESIRLMLSSDAIADANDTLLTSYSSTSLDAHEAVSAILHATLPSDLSAGSYFVYATAAADDAESNTSNNVSDFTAVTIASVGTVSGVDLAIEYVTLSQDSVVAGGQLVINYDVVNHGNLGSVGDSVRVSESGSSSFTVSRLLGEEAFTPVTAGGRDGETITVDIPETTTAGTRYIRLNTGAIDGDMDPSNNEVILSYTVTPAPPPAGVSDLTIENVAFRSDVSNLHPGDTFGIQWDVVYTKDGTLLSTQGLAGLYLSTDPNIDLSDTLLHSEDWGTLWTGQTEHEWDSYVPVPADLDAGTYFLGMIADIENTTDESNENNNLSNVLQLTVGNPRTDPDLVVNEFTISDTAFEVGTNTVVSFSIQNFGELPAWNSRHRVWASQDDVFGGSDDVMLDEILITRIFEIDYPDASISDPVNSTVGQSLEIGDYHIFIEANGDRAITEPDYSNNVVYAGQIEVQAPPPDTGHTGYVGVAVERPASFDVTSVALTDSAEPGAEITGTIALQRSGDLPTGPDDALRVYISTNGEVDARDILWTQFSLPSVMPGAGDQQTVLNVADTLPANLAVGDYSILFEIVQNGEVYRPALSEALNVAPAPAEITATEAIVQSDPELGVEAGASIILENTGGSAVAPGSYLDLVLSDDARFGAGDTILERVAVPELAAGESRLVDLSYTLPRDASVDPRTIFFVQHDGEIGTETVLQTAAIDPWLDTSPPALSVTAIDVDPLLVPGERYRVAVELLNSAGPGDGSPVDLSLMLVDTHEYVLTQFSVTPPLRGQSINATIEFEVPFNVQSIEGDDFDIVVVQDPDDAANSGLPGARAQVDVIDIGLPDLTIASGALFDATGAALGGAVTAGDTVTAQIEAVNLGWTALETSFGVRFLLSDDAIPSWDDLALGGRWSERLDDRGQPFEILEGARATFEVDVTVPTLVSDGEYHLLALVDPGNDVWEIDYLNNLIDLGKLQISAGDPVEPGASLSANWAGSSVDDEIVASTGNDKIEGALGNDSLNGGAGLDALFGGAGDDMLFGGDDDDQLSGGDGNDLIDGGTGVDTALYVGRGPVRIDLRLETEQDTGLGNDRLAEIENLRSGSGNDRLIGNAGNNGLLAMGGTDRLKGGDGDDLLKGGSGNDRLFGQNDDDTLLGQGGKDKLYGGKGDDVLTGGAKADMFYFKTGWGTDTITDFDGKGKVHDVLNLSGLTSIRHWKDLRKHHLEIDGEDIVIDAGNGDLIRLEGVSRGDLDKGDFLF